MWRVVYGSGARSSLVMAQFIYGEKLTDNLGYYQHRRTLMMIGMSMIMLMMRTVIMIIHDSRYWAVPNGHNWTKTKIPILIKAVLL